MVPSCRSSPSPTRNTSPLRTSPRTTRPSSALDFLSDRMILAGSGRGASGWAGPALRPRLDVTCREPILTETGFFALEHVSKRFGVVQALDDVTLAFRPGELLALVGENGAGKSTMMRILEGVFKPDSGVVSHGGTPIVFNEPRDSHAAGIRVIHQEPEIVPNLTVAENVFVGDMPDIGGVLLDCRTLEERTNRVL